MGSYAHLKQRTQRINEFVLERQKLLVNWVSTHEIFWNLPNRCEDNNENVALQGPRLCFCTNFKHFSGYLQVSHQNFGGCPSGNEQSVNSNLSDLLMV